MGASPVTFDPPGLTQTTAPFDLFTASKTLLCSSRNFLGTKETSLLLMAMFLLAVFYHGQQVSRPLTWRLAVSQMLAVAAVTPWPVLQLEYTARLDFLWRVQAKEEINEMKELREHNENMLRNILPSHVARHFLEKDRDNEVRPQTAGRRGSPCWGGAGSHSTSRLIVGAAAAVPNANGSMLTAQR